MKQINLTDQEFIELVCIINESYQYQLMENHKEEHLASDEVDGIKKIMIPLYKKFDLKCDFWN